MRRAAAILSVAAAVLWTTTAFAQGKPNFSGSWTREAPAGGAAAAGGGGGGARGGGGGGQRGGGGGGGGFQCGMTCKITMDATTLKTERTQGEATVTATFKLDGSDSPNPGFARGGGEAPMIVSKATWNGDKLVISTTRDMQGTAVTATQTLSLEGGKLVVETNSGREGATPQKLTYTKG